MTDTVQIFEVAPRDGLQNEKQLVATADKIALVDMLAQSGLGKIEVTSFVSPRWVPQFTDAADVMAGIARNPGVRYAALTPNLRGLEAAVASGADEVAIFASASQGFSKANINCSIEESLHRFQQVMDGAMAAGMPVRGYVSCITDCPYDGPTKPGDVAEVAAALFEMGCYEISLGDTLGSGTPARIKEAVAAVLERLPVGRLAGHFHDSGGNAIANIETALTMGIRVFDSSAGGLGGCPYAPGAKGNVATEALVTWLERAGLTTGVDQDRLALAAEFARKLRSAA